MRAPAANRHAANLDDLRRRARHGWLLAFTTMMGVRLAVDVYSGPSISTGLLIAALAAVILWLSLLYLPEAAHSVLAYILGVLLL
jgi:hypothetical protein